MYNMKILYKRLTKVLNSRFTMIPTRMAFDKLLQNCRKLIKKKVKKKFLKINEIYYFAREFSTTKRKLFIHTT